MAKTQEDKRGARGRQPGRIKQMVQVYQQTKQHDRNLTLWMVLCVVAPVALSVATAFVLNRGSVFAWVLWPLTGVLLGLLLAMIVLGRRAEHVAYSRIEGQAGAVSAVIGGALRRSWRGTETPIAVTRQQDALYRVVGRGGVVLIAEGSGTRARQLAVRESAKLKHALRGVKLTTLYVGPDEGAVPLARLSRTLIKMKPVLTRREVDQVYKRLVSMKADPVGIPKGIDPFKVRPQRAR